MKKTNKYTESELKEAVKNSKSIAETCRQLNIRPTGGNYITIKKYIKIYDIDKTHFTGMGWNVGLKFKPFKTISLEDILIENSSYTSSSSLKKKLFNEGIKEKKCECCCNTEWMGKEIPLELHHINGDNTDNRIENLKILCNNCHAQTENFRRGKSSLSDKRLDRYNKRGEMVPIIKKEKNNKVKKIIVCESCGNEVKNKKNKYCSHTCYLMATKGKRPEVFELIDKFKEYGSFVKVGKFYEVSDNAVRKWVELYGINEKIKDFLKYIKH